MSIETLSLHNYRNFSSFEINTSGESVIICGENGAGKTNILESISLLSPGLGLRNAHYLDICKLETEEWSVESIVASYVPFRIHMSCDSSHKRNVIINDAKSHVSEFLKILNVVWLTPQMLNLLIGPAASRRKFLDKVTYGYDHKHAIHYNKYNHYLSERLKLLKNPSMDEQWLNAIEKTLAELSSEISISRQNASNKLQRSLDEITRSGFTSLTFEIINSANENSQDMSKDDLIEFNMKQFYDNRKIDSIKKQTTFGPHKSDFKVTYRNKNMDGRLCSTGEQKIILITLVLAQALGLDKDKALILLLDEIFTHLDEYHRTLLGGFLSELKAQKWITTTELDHIATLKNNYNVLRLD